MTQEESPARRGDDSSGGIRILPRVRVSTLVLLLLLLASTPFRAAAAENAGVGVSLGIGVAGYSPAPRGEFRIALPSMEVAVAPGSTKQWQVRIRAPLLNTIYAAALRQQLDLQADVFLLKLGQCDCPAGNSKLRPVGGPMLGARLNVAPGVVQPGVAVGGRFGVEYVNPKRRLGVMIAGEPFFELRGGSAGPRRMSLTTGGGAMLVVAISGYQKP